MTASAGAVERRRAPAKVARLLQGVADIFLIRLQRLFYRLGRYIGDSPIIFLLISLSISILFAGLFHLQFAQRLQDGFVSRKSAARAEQAVKTAFDGIDDSSMQKFVALIRKRDQTSLLGRQELDTVFRIHSFISNLKVEVNNRTYRHADLCNNHCETNGLLDLFRQCVEGVYTGKDVFVDHPKAMIGSFSFLIAHQVFGITRKDEDMMRRSTEDEIFIPYNSEHTFPVESNRTALQSIDMIALYFQVHIPDANMTNIVTKWEDTVFRWSQIQEDFPHYRIDVMGDKVLGQEMIKSGMSLMPYLIVGVVFIIAFVTVVVGYSYWQRRRFDCGMILVILGILFSPIFAVLATFGIMGFIGVELYPVHMVIPFLIMAIGVDDAFLMKHAWDRILPEYEPFLRESRRAVLSTVFAKVIEEIGPSITITSLTNALAFGIGTSIATPAMQMFCICAAVAIVLDFVLEITLFGSLLVISGTFYKAPETKPRSGSILEDKTILIRYSQLLTKNWMRFTVIGCTLAFFCVSLYGTLRIETKIDSQKIIPSGSALLVADSLFKKYYWKEYEPILIYVTNPPDISNPEERLDFHRMVADFESIPRAIGNTSTMLWLNHYEESFKPMYNFYSALGSDYPISYDEVPFFMEKTDAGKLWGGMVKWHINERNKTVVDQFFFATGIHNSTSWMERAENMRQWRAVAERWTQFDVYVYSENSAVFEGIFNLSEQTLQTAGLTLFCMAVVCFFFVPSVVGVAIASFAIISISIGVIGFLSLLGLDLDPVTMSAIVMSIGFSVDYTAHICYHYQRAWKLLKVTATAEDCLVYTISAVGWPMVQAALSTLICFIPVIVHPDYTPTVFLRTIMLVVLFGVIHGLVVLPTLLAMTPRYCFVSDNSSSNTVINNYPQTLPLVIEIKSDCSSVSLLPPPQDALSSSLSTSSNNDTSSSLLTSSENESS